MLQKAMDHDWMKQLGQEEYSDRACAGRNGYPEPRLRLVGRGARLQRTLTQRRNHHVSNPGCKCSFRIVYLYVYGS